MAGIGQNKWAASVGVRDTDIYADRYEAQWSFKSGRGIVVRGIVVRAAGTSSGYEAEPRRRWEVFDDDLRPLNGIAGGLAVVRRALNTLF